MGGSSSFTPSLCSIVTLPFASFLLRSFYHSVCLVVATWFPSSSLFIFSSFIFTPPPPQTINAIRRYAPPLSSSLVIYPLSLASLVCVYYTPISRRSFVVLCPPLSLQRSIPRLAS